MKTVTVELDSGRTVKRNIPVERVAPGIDKDKPAEKITGADDYFERLYARHQANRAKAMQRIAPYRIAKHRITHEEFVANIDDDPLRHRVFNSLNTGEFKLVEDEVTGEIYLKQAKLDLPRRK